MNNLSWKNLNFNSVIEFFSSLNDLKLWPNKILLFAYFVVFVVGLFSNTIVIYFVLVYKRMQSMTNKFITNLAVADLMVIFICIPDTATRYLSNEWRLGRFFCRFTGFVQGVSVMTLTAISIDRYYIIYKPMKARSICTNRKVKIIVMATWVLSIFIMSPLLYIFDYEELILPNQQNITNFNETNNNNNNYRPKFIICVEKWPHYEMKLTYDIFLACILFLFPVVFMSYAYFTISQTLWFVEKKEKMNENIIESIKSRNSRLLANKKTSSSFHAGLNNEINKPEKKTANEDKLSYKNSIKQQTTTIKEKKEKISKFKYKLNFKKRISEKNYSSKNHVKSASINNLHDDCCYIDKDLNRELAYSLLDASSVDNNEMNDFRGSFVSRGLFKNSFINKSWKRRSTKSTVNHTKRYSNAPAINSLIFQLKIYNTKNSSFKKSTSTHAHSCINNNSNNNMSNKTIIVHHQNELAINKLIKSRRRVVKLLIILVVLFIISWLPYHITSLSINLVDIYNVKQKNASSSADSESLKQKDGLSSILSEEVFPMSLWLALANSATNPVCYMALSHGFRTMLKTSFKRCFRCW